MQTSEFDPGLAHAVSVEAAVAGLQTGLGSGLSTREAGRRLEAYGPNRLSRQEQRPGWLAFLGEVWGPLIVLLLATGVLYAVWGNLTDTLAIGVLLLILIAGEAHQRRGTDRAMAVLDELSQPAAWVRRSGQAQQVPAAEVVPGDVLLLEAGQRVAADARLAEAYGLAADESALSGEARAVEKDAGAVLPADTAPAERANMVYAGTFLVRGRGTALAMTTGADTALGRAAGTTRASKPPATPLQQAARHLSGRLLWPALACSVVIPVLGLLSGQPLRLMLLTGFALAFATIPAELPGIVRLILVRGAYRMAGQGAIVRRLAVVESLGAVTVIATDKTGALTENQMAVARTWPEAATQRLLVVGALCNDAPESSADGAEEQLGQAGAIHRYAYNAQLPGDPLELALLRRAGEAGVDAAALRRAYVQRNEFTFDASRRLMSVVYERGIGGAAGSRELWAAVKGAPEVVLARSTTCVGPHGRQILTPADRSAALAAATGMAAGGLQVIACAERSLGRAPGRSPAGLAAARHLMPAEVEANLIFVGLVGLAGLPRREASSAIAAARAAGIRTIMITGDHPLTARAVAAQVSLSPEGGRVMTGAELDAPGSLSPPDDAALDQAVETVDVFARAAPEHKLRITQTLQAHGARVAVLGDGINDAPVLAAAEVGAAKGETGTDVARAAADLVLADDRLATVVHAVEQGRLALANLTKAARYYLACKVALATVIVLPAVLGLPVPFAPVQIVLLALFIDLAAAPAFAAEPAEYDLLRRPPCDPGVRFMNRRSTIAVAMAAGGLAAAVIVAYLLAWYGTFDAAIGSGDVVLAQSMAFFTWLLGHALLALNMRSEREPLFRAGLSGNRLMLWWAGAALAVVLLAAFLPPLQELFKTTAPAGPEWALVAGLAVLGTFWMEGRKLITWRGA